MISTSERRLAIRDAISDRRFTTIKELMRDFGVGRETIKRDIAAISEITSFYTTPGKGGGIHAVDGWYASKRYLTAEQEDLLERLTDGLQTDSDKHLMETILSAFAMPKQKDS